jgi:hypothetical protein
MSDKFTNHLAKEKSPYLLQHVHNPVDWYAWGEEAFAKAKEEDKPVFLSIGYSTCHWCHVMERESFEDQEVADILNRSFVAVKVDREERPDVDHIYMSVCQALTGQGGWPLTVIMSPDKKPFFVGTYFPKTSKWGRPGLLETLVSAQERWVGKREELLGYGEKIANVLMQHSNKNTYAEIAKDALAEGFAQLESSFDAEHGGFSPAPKFPTPHNMLFLLRHWRHTGKENALAMVEKTLTAMRQGGIYDHLGFGFARYSTDEKWLVPHFEKMLYDNALLCCTYLEAYQCTGNEDFARVAEEILTYVLRDMTDEDGGFYSAEDADSEGVEGKFYVFTRKEILAALGETRGAIFADFYGITAEGNFEHGASILNTTGRDVAGHAVKVNMSIPEFEELLEESRSKLFRLREKRIHPHKDDKILTAWNALMIVAFAKAARILKKVGYAAVAERALEFIYAKLVRQDGRLLARYRQGEAAHLAYLDDYAFLLWALLEVYETTFVPEYLRQATELVTDMKLLFWDEQQGGFYFYGADGEALLTRPKELYDGAIPSGNSVAALGLLKLASFTADSELEKLAEQLLKSFSGEVANFPRGYTYFLMALDYYWAAHRQIVIAGPADSTDTWAMLSAAGKKFLPDTVIMFHDPGQHEVITEVLPHISEQNPINGQATAYVCENFACQSPVTDMEQFITKLDAL